MDIVPCLRNRNYVTKTSGPQFIKNIVEKIDTKNLLIKLKQLSIKRRG
jgi:hypothetical protein